MNIRQQLDHGPMTPFQWMAISICTMIIMLDGFDVLVMAFTAASISAEWGLNGKQLGLLFSAGLLGMAIGSLVIAPLADRIGRQPITLACLVVVSGGMLASATAQDHTQLGIWRGITGVGIGGMLASVGIISAEYSSNKWRSACVAFQATGYPIGAVLGGLAASWLLTHHGWRSVFVFGGLASAVMIPLVMWRLPESVDFLIDRQPANALRKLNRLMNLLGYARLERLPAPTHNTSIKGSKVAALFSAQLAPRTIAIWAGFFLLMFSFYFSMSWTPKLLVEAGLSNSQGVTGGILLNLGGIVGGGIFGLLVTKMPLVRLTVISMIVTACVTAAFGFAYSSLGLAFAVAFLLGVFLEAAMVGLYGLVPATYPSSVRVTGLGWAIGIGRAGAVLSPFVAGLLLDSGWKAFNLYYVFAIPMLGAAIAVMYSRAASKSANDIQQPVATAQ